MAPSPAIVRAMREAVAHHQAGRFAEAERIYRDVLAQSPNDPDALHLLGLLAHQAGRHDAAIDLIGRAVAVRPQAEFFVNLAQAYRGLGQLRKCADACARSTQLAPNLPEAHNNLGNVLKDLGRHAEAQAALSRAIQLRPNYVQAITNLGNVLAAMGRLDEAEAALRRAIAINPRHAEAYSNLGHVLNRRQRFDEAVAACRQAIALSPNLHAAHVNLGTALYHQGDIAGGNEAYRKGNSPEAQHNLLAGLHYTTAATPQHTAAAHAQWGARFDPITAAAPPHANDRSPHRRLRIGYVSPDLHKHSVTYFLQPLLAHHDRSNFEITAYSDSTTPDAVTERLRTMCDRWRDTAGVSDPELAEQVRHDQIDILVDLAGHTARNRLAMFALKPAPVQVTYLGYPATTGVKAIEYRITDEIADPPGVADALHTEQLLRVSPPPFLCFAPDADAPQPSPEPPALRNGHATFGSFNKVAKVGPESVALWGKVLRAVSNSRLLLKAGGLGGAGSRARLESLLRAEGIYADRVEMLEGVASTADHLAQYRRVDVALDTFPYHGTTTTCEALWMGVPVVSRVGSAHVSRVGATLLAAVGFADLAAADDTAFVAAAAGLASDVKRLTELHATLRDRMRGSLLTDAPAFAPRIERLFRQIWVESCTARAAR